MQDKLNSTLDLASVSLTLSDELLANGRDDQPQVIKSRNKFGSAITIQRVDKTLSIKGNPIGFLTGQNVYGPCDVMALNQAMFSELRDMGVLKFTKAGWTKIKRGEYKINEIAFAQYMRCNPLKKRDQVSHLEMLYTSIIPDWEGHSIHTYHECGFILRRRTMSMTVYDKIQEIEDSKRYVNTQFTGDLETLEDKLRVELTFKYNWLQGRRLLDVRSWATRVHNESDGDWNKFARQLVIQSIEQFRLPYVLTCPNVFHPEFYESLDRRVQPMYQHWLSGRKIEASGRRALAEHGLWADIGPDRHRQLLWQRMFPGVDVVKSITGDPRTMMRMAEMFNQRDLPIDPLCGSLLPLDETVLGSGPRKRLAKINKRLELM